MISLKETANCDIQSNYDKVVEEGLKHGNLEGNVECTNEHEEDAAWTQDGSNHHHNLI
jgi:hypothetical protein